MGYGFVVLNFNNFQDTIDCVKSILEIESNDYRIVIVDNDSPNDSFLQLKGTFAGHKFVSVVKSPRNLGYSGGNNVGIRLLLAEGIRNIIVATNDTILLSRDILAQVSTLSLDGVGMIGPDIITPEGVHQNPPRIKPDILYLLLLHFYSPWTSLREWLYRRLAFIAKWRKVRINQSRHSLSRPNISEKECSPVYMLHGAFFILTERYFSRLGLLDEHLFMYWEEDLLAWQCENAGLLRIFLPTIRVLHKDRKSTELSHHNAAHEFIRINNLKSRNYVAQQVGFYDLLVKILKYQFAPTKTCEQGNGRRR